MRRQKARVILASEHPQVRYFLRDMVEAGGGAVIVGQAENAAKALTLVGNLRPDIAIIDSHLPHAVGLDTVALSRIAGLDTAQTISAEIPKTRVVMVNNLDEEVWREHGLGGDIVPSFCREAEEACIPFTLQELYHEELPSGIIFASVEGKQHHALWQKVANISDKTLLVGGFGTVSGLILMVTVIFTGAGIFLAVGGAVTMFLGLAGKLTASLWPKIRPTRSLG